MSSSVAAPLVSHEVTADQEKSYQVEMAHNVTFPSAVHRRNCFSFDREGEAGGGECRGK